MAPSSALNLNNTVLVNETLIDPNTVISNGPSVWPLHYVRNWQPFRIDALGLVTLLGAEEVNASIGTLVRSRVFEYMPLLGAFVISSDAFREKQSAYKLYNVSKGIETTSLAAWFTRWLKLENFHTSCSEIEWHIIPNSEAQTPVQRFFEPSHIFALSASVVIQLWFISFTVLMSDWWGLCNAISMSISVLVRWWIIKKNRDWLDDAVARAEKSEDEDIAKIIITTSDSKAISMKVRNSLMVPCFTSDPTPFTPRAKHDQMEKLRPGPPPAKDWDINDAEPPTPARPPLKKPKKDKAALMIYDSVRWIGWLAFGGHVITIGMSDLVTQIITVVLIVVPTIGTCLDVVRRHTCDTKQIGSRLRAETLTWTDEADEERRIDTYARLHLTDVEEVRIKKWDLTPDETEEKWWKLYGWKKEWYAIDAEERKRQIRARRVIERSMTPHGGNFLVPSANQAAHNSPQKPTGTVTQTEDK